MLKLTIVILITACFLFGNEKMKSIEELIPNDKQLKVMIEQEQAEKEKDSLFEKIIILELEKYGENKSYFENKDNSEIIHKLQKRYEINKNELLFLISSSLEDFDCHICIPKMNWFHLKEENDKWTIQSKILNRDFTLGTWGSFPIPELIKIGKNDIAFKYIFSYSQNGYTETKLLIESFKNDKFSEILQEDFAFDDTGVYEENEEHNNWQGTLSIINKNKKHYDLLIEKKGLKDLKKFYSKRLYVFQNNKYILE
ncbi:hypothetical protein [Poseidonibacter antarcticus]|uniref:hypothetical protein n=1 Tax=Poseidonibacter antarcticus TaxID=2478538 RepID=UPI000EF46E9D|nr:hypothetical protein [Poseidonibacter antarcticus]